MKCDTNSLARWERARVHMCGPHFQSSSPNVTCSPFTCTRFFVVYVVMEFVSERRFLLLACELGYTFGMRFHRGPARRDEKCPGCECVRVCVCVCTIWPGVAFRLFHARQSATVCEHQSDGIIVDGVGVFVVGIVLAQSELSRKMRDENVWRTRQPN